MQIAAEGYKIRWYNQPIYICEYLDDGLTRNGANAFEGHKNNYRGYCYYISQCMKKKPLVEKMFHLREYDITAGRLGKGIRQRAFDIGFGCCRYLLCTVLISVGCLIKNALKK